MTKKNCETTNQSIICFFSHFKKNQNIQRNRLGSNCIYPAHLTKSPRSKSKLQIKNDADNLILKLYCSFFLSFFPLKEHIYSNIKCTEFTKSNLASCGLCRVRFVWEPGRTEGSSAPCFRQSQVWQPCFRIGSSSLEH